MKIQCLLENIKNAVVAAERVTSKNQTLPILSSVFIGTEKEKIKIKSTNLETALEIEISGKIQEAGSIIVPAKALNMFLSNLSGEQATIESKKENFYIKTKNTETTIRGYPLEDFPIFPKTEATDKIKISGAEIKDALSSVILAASISDVKPELASIFFNVFKNTIKIAATDSFRLAEKIITSKNFYSERQISFLIPQKTTLEIIRILDKHAGEIELGLNKNQIIISFPGFKFTARLTEGNFPDYDQIIPKAFKTTAVVKKSEFLSNIKIASIFSGKLGDLTISFQPGQRALFMSTSNSESGEHESSAESQIQGEEVILKFNWRYLLDGAAEINNEYISFHANNEQSPLLMKGKGDNSYFYLAMPMRGV